jgi:aminopeptidase N
MRAKKRVELFVMSVFAFAAVQAMASGSVFALGGGRSVPTDSDPSTRNFTFNGKLAAPADFESMELAYDFDIKRSWATATATIKFKATESGYPYFMLKGKITDAQLNGQPVGVARIKPELSTSRFEIIDRAVAKGSVNVFKIRFQVYDYSVSFRDSGVGFITAMADLKGGNFFDDYGPSAFEDDQHRIGIEVHVRNAYFDHQIFSNGVVSAVGENHWRVDFPEFYNSTAIYLHVTGEPLKVIHGTYKGLERAIPYTVYAKKDRGAFAVEAAKQMPKLFAELEGTYGPYLHRAFVAYISGRGGMEHAGAAITSIGALDHELLHSWFARGVFPSDGRSGWIDEGIASWRDNGYFRTAWPPSREAANLATFPAFERFTPKNGYADGSQLLSELDALLASRGGMRPVLKEFFAEWKTRNVTTPLFQLFLEMKLGIDLDSVFRRYVYGDSGVPAALGVSTRREGLEDRHPPALTAEEIADLR